MRQAIAFTCLLFSLFAGGAVHAQSVDSKVDAVTVYTQGARVTRSAEVSLPAGDTALTFTGLSADIDPARLQVELAGAAVQLGQIKFNDVQQRAAFDAEVRALLAQIQEVQDGINALSDSTKTAELQLKFLDGIAQGYAKESWFEGARGNADITSWRGALTILQEGSAAARSSIRDNAAAQREATADLSRLQRELQQLRGRQRVSQEIVVTVAASRAQQATIKLHYFMAQASWSPQYVANLDSSSRHLRLQQQALVEQHTDEDWLNVALTLSTSQPSGELEAPEATSEFLDLLDPSLQGRYSAAPMPQRAKAARADSIALEEVVVTGMAAAPQVDVGAYSVTYQVPGRVDVHNDTDDELSVDLANLSFTADLLTRIVPRESAQAFLVAKFTYNEDLPLYANDMQVYVDQVFVGETWLSTVLPNDEITLPMGQDRRVELVVRNQGGRKGESGFIGRRKQELTSNLFEITNRRDNDTVVEVFDRYPQAVNEDIEVSIPREATTPMQTDFEDKPGVIVWRKSLAAGDTWSIQHQYEVSYPADMVIQRR